MEKTKRNWLITGIIAVAMIFSCMLGLGLNSQVQTAYAYTTEDFVEHNKTPMPADEKNCTISWKTSYAVDYYTVSYYYYNNDYQSDDYGWQEQVVVNYTGPTIPAGTLMSYTANIDDLYAQYGDWFTFANVVQSDGYFHCTVDFKVECGTNAKDSYGRDVHCSRGDWTVDWKKTDTTKPPLDFIMEPQNATVQVGNSYTVTWSFGMDIYNYYVLLYEVDGNVRHDLAEFKSPKGLIPAGQELSYVVPAQPTAKELRVSIVGYSYERMWEEICGFWEDVPRYEPGTIIKITWQTGEVKSTVSFNANGGSGEMASVNDVKGTYELPECTFTAPTDKQFAGWALSSSGAILGNTIEVNQNTTLYAIWEDVPVETYTVSFNSNGGSGTMADVTAVAGVYELPENGFTAPNGKVFSGWAFSANGDTIPTEKVQITADTELYAIWVTPAVTIQPLSGVTKIGEQYTISWSANFTVTAWQIWKMQSSDNSNHYDWKAGGMVDARPEIIIAPGTVNMYSLSQPAGITSQPYQIDIYYKDANNVEQTIYSDKFVVDWVGPNVSEVVLTSNVPEILVDVDVPENVTAATTTEHLTVSGTALCIWDTDKETWRQYPGDKIVGGVQYGLSVALNIEAGSMLTDDVAIVFNGTDVTSTGHTDVSIYNNTAYVIVLLGDPTATYTVSFNNNDGAGEMDAVNGVLGEYTLPTTCPFEKIDHHFVGWALSSNGAKITTATINVEADTELFAVWEENAPTTYTVTYKPNNETAGVVRNDIPAGAYSLEDNHFVAPSGKQFKAWNVNGTEKQPGETITISENTIIVAVWEDVEVEPEPQPEAEPTGLSAGAIVGIVLAVVVVGGVGGFALVWFVIKKKKWADFVALFKKK